ncbi:heat shock transcription factor, X-linked member 3-like [Moschus berezovskii]|uniref:heat shock transcription factor, X-linked member 3-like n=1 Tax=Moschus berezovskii TaxID=68408 RepID=UPI0024448425|nr:heat shock transcription factor, X-linked member 3-like [Moschus berezovskii]
MASQSSHNAHTAPLAPLTYGEPAAGDLCDSSPDPNVVSGDTLEKQGDQPKSPDPGLQYNLPPQDQKPEMANKEEDNAFLRLSFPRKLWRILEDEAFTSVHWNDEGDMVVIEADLFQTEVLQRRGSDQIFETDCIKSFIRELNLYGFSKISPLGHSAGNKKIMIYHNSNFQRDKPLLLQNIPKRKKRAVATRHSPRLHHNQCTQEVGKKVQKGTPPAHRTPSRRSFLLSHLWSMGSVARRAMANHLPGEQGSPSGKGTSSGTASVPPATSGRESTGQMPESPPEYPDYDSVMALYNTCYSILTAALSFTARNEAPEAEEEQGESSDYKCVLCEQVKDKPNP